MGGKYLHFNHWQFWNSLTTLTMKHTGMSVNTLYCHLEEPLLCHLCLNTLNQTKLANCHPSLWCSVFQDQRCRSINVYPPQHASIPFYTDFDPAVWLPPLPAYWQHNNATTLSRLYFLCWTAKWDNVATFLLLSGCVKGDKMLKDLNQKQQTPKRMESGQVQKTTFHSVTFFAMN